MFVFTLTFAGGAVGSALQAVAWLPHPERRLPGKLYRLLFAAAACALAAFFAAYGLIGIRLWSC